MTDATAKGGILSMLGIIHPITKFVNSRGPVEIAFAATTAHRLSIAMEFEKALENELAFDG